MTKLCRKPVHSRGALAWCALAVISGNFLMWPTIWISMWATAPLSRWTMKVALTRTGQGHSYGPATSYSSAEEFWLAMRLLVVFTLLILPVEYLLSFGGWKVLRTPLRWRRSFFLWAWAWASLCAPPVLCVLQITLQSVYMLVRRDGLLWGEAPLIILWVGYFFLVPDLLVLWDVRRRAQRLATPRCTRCGYLLRGLQRPVCPECDQEFTPGILRKTGTIPHVKDRAL